MKRNKIEMDRPVVSSEEIKNKQDFNKVIQGAKKAKPPILKNPWFYGSIGLASLALIITLTQKEEQFEEKSTLSKNSEIILPDDTECIHKPIENINEKVEVFYVKPDVNKTVQLSSGTEITFPEGSLIVDDYSDSVRIEVKEYYDKSSVFLSGIMMDKGSDSAFESAGMIEIKGFVGVGDENCLINDEKPLEVTMVLNKDHKGFPFWMLDTLKKDWVSFPVNYSKIKKSENSNDTFHKTKKVLEGEIQSLNQSIVINNQNKESIVEPNYVDYHISKKGNQQFDLSFDSMDFPELKSFEGMNFEVFTDKKYDKSFTKKTWYDVALEKIEGEYFAIFKNKNEEFKIQVRPVLTGDDNVKAIEEFNIALNESEKIKLELEEERRELEKELSFNKDRLNALVDSFKNKTKQDLEDELLVRKGISVVRASDFVASFTITQFGTYNCDKENNYPKSFDRDFIFSYNGTTSTQIQNAYVFDQDKNVRFSYGQNCRRGVDNLGFFKESESMLVTIDKEGNLGYVLKLDEFSFEKEILKIKKIDKKDVNLALIQKLLSETPSNS